MYFWDTQCMKPIAGSVSTLVKCFFSMPFDCFQKLLLNVLLCCETKTLAKDIDQLLKLLPGILDSPAGWSSTSPWCTFPTKCCLSKLSSSLDVLHLTGITLALIELTWLGSRYQYLKLKWNKLGFKMLKKSLCWRLGADVSSPSLSLASFAARAQ